MKVIKSEKDYNEAIARLSQLMSESPAPNTAEGNELEVLAVLIEKYENETIDLGPVDPVEAIKLRMEQSNPPLTNRDLAAYIGSSAKVSEVLNRKVNLSLKMIRALHKGLGIPYSSLVPENPAAIEERAPFDFSKVPVKEMFDRTLLQSRTSLADAKEHLEESLVDLFGEKKLLQMQNAFLKSSVRSGREMNRVALEIWHLLALKEAEKKPPQNPFNHALLTDELFDEVARQSVFDNGPTQAIDLLAQYGIRVVMVEHFKKTYLDGAALKNEDGPIIALTGRHDRLDNFWFVLLHELAHIQKHLYTDDDVKIIYDDLDVESKDSIETEADEIAIKTLMPEALVQDIESATTQAEIKNAARLHHRSPAIVAGYLRKKRNNYRIFNALIGRGEVRSQFTYL